MPQVVAFDRITTLHLAFHAWPHGLHLPSLRHVTLTNNLITLKDFSLFPKSIRSIQIIFRPFLPNYVAVNWSVLHSLNTLPLLTSLHIVLHDMSTALDSTACQIIAETVPMLTHCGISFRQQRGLPSSDRPPITREEADAQWQADLLAYPWLAQIPFVEDDDDNDDPRPNLQELVDSYRTSIEEIRRRIFDLPLDKETMIVVEAGGCGLTVWL